MIHVLLPAFNEETALERLLEKIEALLRGASYRVWVVDDGSTDDTAEVVAAWARTMPLTLLSHAKNAGLGQAFQTGLKALLPALGGNDVLVTMDADDTHPPELITALSRPLLEGRFDMAIASRFAPGGKVTGVPLLRRFTSWGARLVFHHAFHVPGVRDYTCGYRAYRADLLKRGQDKWGSLVSETGFASAVEWLLKLAHTLPAPRILEVPLDLRYDKKPTPSKMKIFQTIQRTLAVVGRLKKITAP